VLDHLQKNIADMSGTTVRTTTHITHIKTAIYKTVPSILMQIFIKKTSEKPEKN